jgi:hypothetical protein
MADDTSTLRTRFAQLRARVVEPALGYLQLPGGEAAIRLVMGTAAQESGLDCLAQRGSGPALGYWQIEPATFDDLLANTLPARRDLSVRLVHLTAEWPEPKLQLASNLAFSAAVCRLLYWRAPDPLPAANDIDGLGRYWKRFYNTPAGAGTVAEFVSNYRRCIGG